MYLSDVLLALAALAKFLLLTALVMGSVWFVYVSTYERGKKGWRYKIKKGEPIDYFDANGLLRTYSHITANFDRDPVHYISIQQSGEQPPYRQKLINNTMFYECPNCNYATEIVFDKCQTCGYNLRIHDEKEYKKMMIQKPLSLVARSRFHDTMYDWCKSKREKFGIDEEAELESTKQLLLSLPDSYYKSIYIKGHGDKELYDWLCENKIPFKVANPKPKDDEHDEEYREILYNNAKPIP